MTNPDVQATTCENCGNPASGENRGDARRFRKNRVGATDGELALCGLCRECEERRREHTGLVVDSTETRRLIVAGPGTGKTFAFGQVIEELPDGTSVLAFTLINNLARDLQSSLSAIPEREVSVNTFHGYCKRLLHSGFNSGELGDDFHYFPDLPELIEEDASFLGRPYTRKSFHGAFATMERGVEMTFYLDRGAYYNSASHDDAVWRVHEHLSSNRESIPVFDLVIADELQDFNELEASFIELLSEPNAVLLAGDDDQALYGFRHASTDFIRRLHGKDEAFQNLELPFCSRCTSVIVEATNAVVQSAADAGLLAGRIPRQYLSYWPDKYEESRRYPTIEVAACSARQTVQKLAERRILDLTERDGLVGEEDEIGFMVIGPERRPDLLRGIADHLLSTLDPEKYKVVTKERTESGITLLEAYRLIREDDGSNLGWRLILTLDPVEKVEQIIRTTVETGAPLRELLPEDYVARHLHSAREEAEEEEDEEPENCEEAPDDSPRIKVMITNFLGSKGLAASHVIIVGMNNGLFPEVPSNIGDGEVCRFIVGLTRAKRSCALVTHKEYDPTRKRTLGKPSAFLSWLSEECTEVRSYRVAGGELADVT